MRLRFVAQLVAVIRGIHQKLGNANHKMQFRNFTKPSPSIRPHGMLFKIQFFSPVFV
jgi:hypothetical protein